MCGIVLIGSKSMVSADVARFEKLLYCDVFRGPHSTGVFTQRRYGYGKDAQDPEVNICKDAVEAAYFLDSPEWKECRDGNQKTAKLGNFYVGHNRYATMGAKTAKNAHPFNHGDITLVHNGTLSQQSLLPDHKKFDVDSENICHSINKIGAAETIQLLNGAFTLVWFDASDQTLHIIRNEDRPFHLAETSTGDWYGASEEDMLMWILTRSKYNPTIKRHFEIEVGVEYIFDAKPGQFSLKEEVKHELPTFRYVSAYANTTGTNYASQSRGFNQITRETTVLGQSTHSARTSSNKSDENKTCNQRLADAGIKKKHGDIIDFSAHHFGAYSKGTTGGQGLVEGYLEDMEEYIEIQAHQCPESAYFPYAPMKGTIVGAFRENGVLTVICTYVDPDKEPKIPEMTDVTDADDGYSIVSAMLQEEQEAEEEEKTQMLNGDTYTRAEWERSGHCQCGVCSSPVDFEEATSLDWYNNEPVCDTCRDDLFAELAEEEYAKSQQPEPEDAIDWEKRDFTFSCAVCGEPTDLNNEGKHAGHCKKCSPRRETLKLVKEANKNLQPNTTYCHNGCGKEVKNKTFMHNGKAMCPQCWSDLKQQEDQSSKKNQCDQSSTRVRLTNGRLVTSKDWKKMDRCNCGYRIPFKFAQYALIALGKPVCDKCAQKLI